MHKTDNNSEDSKDSAGDTEMDLLSLVPVTDGICKSDVHFDIMKCSREGISIVIDESDEIKSARVLDSNKVKCRIVQENDEKSDKSTTTESQCIPRSSTNCDSILENFDALTICDNEQIDDLIFQQDDDGDNLLFMAIIDNRLSITMGLITLARDSTCFKIYNDFYQTALHLASLMNMPTIVRRLVVAGAIVDQQDRHGNTALHIACKHGYIDVANALLAPVKYHETKLNSYEIPYQKIPQNLEIRNSEGLTCLHLATLGQNTKMISLLTSNDADVNTVEMKAGKTSLHIAAEQGDDIIVSELIKHPECDLDKETFAGYTASELARCRGDHEIERLLCRSGASIPRDIEEIEQSRVFIGVYYDEHGAEIVEISSEDDTDDDDN